MLIEQIIEFELSNLNTVYFRKQNKNFQGKFNQLYFATENTAKDNVPCFPHLGQVTNKI